MEIALLSDTCLLCITKEHKIVSKSKCICLYLSYWLICIFKDRRFFAFYVNWKLCEAVLV